MPVKPKAMVIRHMGSILRAGIYSISGFYRNERIEVGEEKMRVVRKHTALIPIWLKRTDTSQDPATLKSSRSLRLAVNSSPVSLTCPSQSGEYSTSTNLNLRTLYRGQHVWSHNDSWASKALLQEGHGDRRTMWSPKWTL